MVNIDAWTEHNHRNQGLLEETSLKVSVSPEKHTLDSDDDFRLVFRNVSHYNQHSLERSDYTVCIPSPASTRDFHRESSMWGNSKYFTIFACPVALLFGTYLTTFKQLFTKLSNEESRSILVSSNEFIVILIK